MGSLPQDHFRCTVTHQPLPPFHLLNGRYFDWASELFRPEMYSWEDSPASPASYETQERIFFLPSFDRIIGHDEIIRSLEEGYRPATLREALACAAPTPAPEIPCPSRISILGSHAQRAGRRIIPIIYRYDGGCDLAFDIYDRIPEIGRRFLFLKK